jgi:hypothetical protein
MTYNYDDLEAVFIFELKKRLDPDKAKELFECYMLLVWLCKFKRRIAKINVQQNDAGMVSFETSYNLLYEFDNGLSYLNNYVNKLSSEINISSSDIKEVVHEYVPNINQYFELSGELEKIYNINTNESHIAISDQIKRNVNSFHSQNNYLSLIRKFLTISTIFSFNQLQELDFFSQLKNQYENTRIIYEHQINSNRLLIHYFTFTLSKSVAEFKPDMKKFIIHNQPSLREIKKFAQEVSRQHPDYYKEFNDEVKYSIKRFVESQGYY